MTLAAEAPDPCRKGKLRRSVSQLPSLTADENCTARRIGNESNIGTRVAYNAEYEFTYAHK